MQEQLLKLYIFGRSPRHRRALRINLFPVVLQPSLEEAASAIRTQDHSARRFFRRGLLLYLLFCPCPCPCPCPCLRYFAISLRVINVAIAIFLRVTPSRLVSFATSLAALTAHLFWVDVFAIKHTFGFLPLLVASRIAQPAIIDKIEFAQNTRRVNRPKLVAQAAVFRKV